MSKMFVVGILAVLLGVLGLLSRQVKSTVDPHKEDAEKVARETAPPSKGAPDPKSTAPVKDPVEQKSAVPDEKLQAEQKQLKAALGDGGAKPETKDASDNKTPPGMPQVPKPQKSGTPGLSTTMDLSGKWSIKRKPGTAGYSALNERQKAQDEIQAKAMKEAMKQSPITPKAAEQMSKGIHPKDDGHGH